jgi:ferritin-like metal-binding protein YciE
MLIASLPNIFAAASGTLKRQFEFVESQTTLKIEVLEMTVKTFNDLFEAELRDVLSAEEQLVEALPKMAKAATDPELIEAFETHLEQTKVHVERATRVLEMCGFKAKAHKCKAMEGLVKEGEEMIKEVKEGPVRDAVLIACAQKVEHYEIASYGTLIEWATKLGQTEAAEILGETLDEEKETDELLTGMAENNINDEALHQAA